MSFKTNDGDDHDQATTTLSHVGKTLFQSAMSMTDHGSMLMEHVEHQPFENGYDEFLKSSNSELLLKKVREASSSLALATAGQEETGQLDTSRERCEDALNKMCEPHTVLTPHLAKRLITELPADMWCAQLFPLLGSDNWDSRDVAHYSRMCRLFRTSLRCVRSPKTGLVVARIPRVNVPSTWAPSIYNALDTFKHKFVTTQDDSAAASAAAVPNSDAVIFEIRLAAGVHPIDRKLPQTLKSQKEWTGIDLRGPEFAGLSICGDGLEKTTLARGRILVGKTACAKGGHKESKTAPWPVRLEGFTVSTPADRNLRSSAQLSVSYKGCVCATSCSFSNGITGVQAFGFGTQVHLIDCICARNVYTGVRVGQGGEVEICGEASRVIDNGVMNLGVISGDLVVEGNDGVIRIIDLGDDESTSPLFQGSPPNINDDGFGYGKNKVYYINDGTCVAQQRDAAAEAAAAELGVEAAAEMGNLFGDGNDEECDY